MKFIKQLEELAFATRIKLLTDRLIQDASKIYKSLDIDFEPRWFSIFYLLKAKSPLSITEISSELSISQPAATQIADILSKKGYVTHVKDKKDTRKRMLALSKKAKKLLPKLESVWDSFGIAHRGLFSSTGYDVMLMIEKLEDSLDKKDMYTRIMEDIKKKQRNNIRIIDYEQKYAKYFKTLNYEWLMKYFWVEKDDEEILSNPAQEVINRGGFIFFAKEKDEVVGTAALIKHNNGTFELAKMAVTEKAQGKQIGKKLAYAVIERARRENAENLYLETSKRLQAAYSLYKKLGFEQVEYNNGESSKYGRASIKMTLNLNNNGEIK
jgi:DNA-binding MarR family transcriptional regulator/N-acetylglutamate synthase-like GNAT family acetyltransferase